MLQKQPAAVAGSHPLAELGGENEEVENTASNNLTDTPFANAYALAEIERQPTKPYGHCPPVPRLRSGLLSEIEKTHASECAVCKAVVEKEKGVPMLSFFEKADQEWLLFKQTRPALYVRATQLLFVSVQTVSIILLCGLFFGFLSPSAIDYERKLDHKTGELKSAYSSLRAIVEEIGRAHV